MVKRVASADIASASPLPESFATGSGAPSNDPRALEKALGLRVRQLRRQQDLSVADLAAAAGLSTGMLSKIENGQISPSLTSLQSLAQINVVVRPSGANSRCSEIKRSSTAWA